MSSVFILIYIKQTLIGAEHIYGVCSFGSLTNGQFDELTLKGKTNKITLSWKYQITRLLNDRIVATIMTKIIEIPPSQYMCVLHKSHFSKEKQKMYKWN